MKRMVVMTENELNVLINRAIFAGVCLHHREPEVYKDQELWKQKCDREREHLKTCSFKD